MVYGRRPRRAAATAGPTNYREQVIARRSRKSTDKYGQFGSGGHGTHGQGSHHPGHPGHGQPQHGGLGEYGSGDGIPLNVRASINHPPPMPWIKVKRPLSTILGKQSKSFLVEKFVKLIDLTEHERKTLLTEKERENYTVLKEKREKERIEREKRAADYAAAQKLAAEQRNGGAGFSGGPKHAFENVPNVSHRRRCARCLEYGTLDQAFSCKGRSRRDFCIYFESNGTPKPCMEKSAVIKRRCIRCVNNGAHVAQALVCKGRSRKAFCIYFDENGFPKRDPYVPPAAPPKISAAYTPPAPPPPLVAAVAADVAEATDAANDAVPADVDKPPPPVSGAADHSSFTLLPAFLEDAAATEETAGVGDGTTTADEHGPPASKKIRIE